MKKIISLLFIFQAIASNAMESVLVSQEIKNQILDAVYRSDNDYVIKAIESGRDVNLQIKKNKTILYYALKEKNKELVNFLLKQKNIDASINVQYAKKSLTPLMLAFEMDDINIIKAFIAKTADVNAKDNNGNTALHYAIKLGNPELVKLLIDAGADVNIENNNLESPIFHALKSKKDKYRPILKMLYDKDAYINKATDKYFENKKFFEAIEKNKPKEIEQALDLGFDINTKDESGKKALELAIDRNNLEMVKLLIKRGANINELSSNKSLLLNLASIWVDDQSIIEFLIDSLKTNINMQDNSGNTLLINLSDCFWKKIKTYQKLVNIPKCNVNIQNNDGETALMKAVKSLKQENIELLLTRPDIDLNIKDKNGETVISRVINQEKKDRVIPFDDEKIISISKNLLTHKNLDINDKDNNGKTALMKLLDWPHYPTKSELIKSILNHPKLDIYAKDNNNLTFGQIAQEKLDGYDNEPRNLINMIRIYMIFKLIWQNCKDIESKKRKIKKLINQVKKDIDWYCVKMQIADDNGNTPLHAAIKKNDIEIAKWLFYLLPESITHKNKLGVDPFELAIGEGCHDFAQDILTLAYTKPTYREIIEKVSKRCRASCILV